MLATEERTKTMEATATAFGYARVSTQAQNAPHNVSLDTQRARISAYCADHGLSLAHIYVDVESGRRDERKTSTIPGFAWRFVSTVSSARAICLTKQRAVPGPR